MNSLSHRIANNAEFTVKYTGGDEKCKTNIVYSAIFTVNTSGFTIMVVTISSLRQNKYSDLKLTLIIDLILFCSISKVNIAVIYCVYLYIYIIFTKPQTWKHFLVIKFS